MKRFKEHISIHGWDDLTVLMKVSVISSIFGFLMSIVIILILFTLRFYHIINS